MSTSIKNVEYIPQKDLDAVSQISGLIKEADAASLGFGKTVKDLHAELSKTAVSFKEITNLINKYEKIAKEANAVDAEKVRLMKEKDRLEAKIAAATSEEAKKVRELKNEYATINKQMNDNIKNSQKLVELEISRGEGNSGVAESIERENKAFAEKAQTLEELAVIEQRQNEAAVQAVQSAQSQITANDAAQSAFDSLTESIQMQTQNLIEMKIERDQVRDQMKGLTKDYQDGNVAHDAYILRTAELTALERDLSTAIDTTAAKLKYETQIATTAVGSYENVSAQYSLMKIEINALGEAEGKNIEHKRALEAQAKSLYETMSQLQKNTGKHTLDVGKYDLAVADLTKTVGLLDPKLGMVMRKVQNIPTFKKAWVTVNNQLVKSLNLSAKAATTLQFALVGLVIGGVLLAVNYFKKLREEQDLIAGANKNANATFAEQYAIVKRLQGEWNALGGNLQSKTKFIKENKKAFEQLGIEVKNVSDAENILVKNTASFLKAMQLRAQANAMQDIAAESYKKMFDSLEDIPGSASELFYSIFKSQNWDNLAKSFVKSGSPLLNYLVSFGEEAQESQRRGDKFIEMSSKMITEAEKLEDAAGIKRKGTTLTDKEINKENKLRRDELKAISDYYNFMAKAIADAQNRIATDNDRIRGQVISDEKTWYETRISALDSYLELQATAIENAAASEIEAAKLKREQGEITEENLAKTILLINAKKAVELGDITKNGEQLRYGITLDYANKRIDALEKAVSLRAAMIEEAESEELKNLTSQYTQGLIDQKTFEDQKLAVARKYADERVQIQLDLLKKEMEILPLESEEREQLALKIAETEIEIERQKNERISEDMMKSFDRRKEATKQYIDFVKDMMSELLDFASALMEARTERELAELEKRREASEESHDEETERIERLEEAGAISTEQANARKAAADQKLREEEKKIEADKAEAQKRQAKFDKAMNVVKIITSTAAAIIRAFSDAGPIAGIPLAVMVGALGAVQLATVLAQPIPEYAEGTDFHKGGAAIVGDGGRPEMVMYGGSVYKTPDVPTLVDLPRGTQVLPDWEKAVSAMPFNPIQKCGSDFEKNPTPFDDKNVLSRIDKTNQSIDKLLLSYNKEKKNNRYYSIIGNNTNTTRIN